MNALRKSNASRSYRRKLHEDEKAVSPVVATLLLILIAVAAAAALYLFVTAFQTSTQKTVGTPGTQPTLTIGGSSTLLPLDAAAVLWFEQNNSDVLIQNNQGGSGAGLLALCEGNVNIAPSSEYITQATGISQTCLNQAVATRIGTSAVEVLTGGSSAVGLQAVNLPELRCIYAINGGANATTWCPSPYNEGLQTPTTPCTLGQPGWATTAGAKDCFVWSNIPVNITSSATRLTSPSTTPIDVYGRADSSGFAEGFISQLLAGSCSGNLISACFPDAISLTGEPAMVSAIQADPNGFGFVSSGYATTDGIGSGFTPAFQGCATYPAAVGCTLQPAPLPASSKYILSAEYQGWRPLDYYTLGAPSGEAAAFINFVEQPYVVAQLCGEQNFIAYTSGFPTAAGQH